MDSHDDLYRPCVGIALFNEEGKVFVGERIDTPGAWQMPQGGIDPDEDLNAAAFRELKEEIGTNKATIIEIMADKIRYDIPPAILERLHNEWDRPYIGQEQTWIAMRYTGNDSDINLAAFDYPEFSQWQWANLTETINLIVPFKREIYQKIIAAFKRYAE